MISCKARPHLIVRSSTVFSEPFVMEAPPLGAYIRLRDFENFVTAEHASVSI